MNVYHTAENEHHRLTIYYDESAESPREWDNLGTMVCWHRRYALGDERTTKSPDAWAYYMVAADNEEDVTDVWEEVLKQYVILPLYLYDHSGITMNTTGFMCQWDSGQVGWIYCEKGKEGLSDERIKGNLIAEVEVYDCYLRGEVFGYVLTELIDGQEYEVDSCWGFYGDDFEKNGMKEYLPDEYKELLP